VSTQRLYSVIYTKTKYLDVLFVRKWWSDRSTKRNDFLGVWNDGDGLLIYRFFFTVLNNLTSPRRVTYLGCPTLGMFSTLPVLLYFFQIERIVDSGICHKNKLFRRVVRKKMVVREVNKKKRLSWCLERRRWTVNLPWNQVIFGDESQIVIGQNNRV
jgi:hypothetical protein